MMKRTSLTLVPFVLCAMGLLSFFVAGCREEKKDARRVVDPPAVYMKDEKFRKALADQREKMKELYARRAPIVDKMRKMIDDTRSKIKSEDSAKIDEVLKKMPEWENLKRDITEINNLIEATRMATTKLVGERIAPRKQVSK